MSSKAARNIEEPLARADLKASLEKVGLQTCLLWRHRPAPHIHNHVCEEALVTVCIHVQDSAQARIMVSPIRRLD
jgi:hypothetical protein